MIKRKDSITVVPCYTMEYGMIWNYVGHNKPTILIEEDTVLCKIK